jgi:predicted RNase H-like nuclease (RuvC/YqgF family)
MTSNIGEAWDGFSPATYTLHQVKRVHRKLFRLNEEIAALQAEANQVAAELEYHRSINDDAQRDAAVGNYIDREEAGLTRSDVRRFERALSDLETQRARLSAKRDKLLAKLD